MHTVWTHRCGGATREQSHAHSVDASVRRRDARAESCTQSGRISAAAQYWSSGAALGFPNGGMASDLDGVAYFAAAVSGSWSAVVNSGAVPCRFADTRASVWLTARGTGREAAPPLQ